MRDASSSEGGTSGVYGPPEPPPVNTSPLYGPKPEQKRTIVLALGPGMVRGFASAGILKSLYSSKLIITHMVATEMSALVAALYAVSSSPNPFEWALMRVNEELFLESEGFFGKFTGGSKPANRLEAFLEKTFQQKTFKDLRIPLTIVVQNTQTREFMVIEDGRLVDALRATLSVQGVLPPYSLRLKGEEWVVASGRHASSFILESARSYPHDLLLEIHLSGQNQKSEESHHQADLYGIKPDLQGIHDLDFTKKNEAIFRGKTNMDREMKKIQSIFFGDMNRESIQNE